MVARRGRVYASAVEAALTRARILLYLLPFTIACGTTGGPTTGISTPTTTPTPAPGCTQTTLLQGTVPIPPKAVIFTELKLAAPARLSASLDWTRTTSTMRLAIVDGSCNADDFQ